MSVMMHTNESRLSNGVGTLGIGVDEHKTADDEAFETTFCCCCCWLELAAAVDVVDEDDDDDEDAVDAADAADAAAAAAAADNDENITELSMPMKASRIYAITIFCQKFIRFLGLSWEKQKLCVYVGVS